VPVEIAIPHKNPTYSSHEYAGYHVRNSINEHREIAPNNPKLTFVYTHDIRFAY